MSLNDIILIYLVWLTISLFCWLGVAKWLKNSEYIIVGHIVFGIITLPTTVIAILVIVIVEMCLWFAHFCRKRIC